MITNLLSEIAPACLTKDTELVLRYLGSVVNPHPTPGKSAFVHSIATLAVIGDTRLEEIVNAHVDEDGNLVVKTQNGGLYSCSTSNLSSEKPIHRIDASQLRVVLPIQTELIVPVSISVEHSDYQAQLVLDIIETFQTSGCDWVEYRAPDSKMIGGAFLYDPVIMMARPHQNEGMVFHTGDYRNNWQTVSAMSVESAIIRIISDTSLCTTGTRSIISDAYLSEENGGCSIDSDIADLIMQIALFDELVFS